MTNTRIAALHGYWSTPSPSRPRPFHCATRALVTSDIRSSSRMNLGFRQWLGARRCALASLHVPASRPPDQSQGSRSLASPCLTTLLPRCKNHTDIQVPSAVRVKRKLYLRLPTCVRSTFVETAVTNPHDTLRFNFFASSPSRIHAFVDEGKQILVDLFLVGGTQTMGSAFVNLELCVLD